MGESLKGFISTELFFLKCNLRCQKFIALRGSEKWSNSHHWITLIFKHFSNWKTKDHFLFYKKFCEIKGSIFFSEKLRRYCVQNFISKGSTPPTKKPKTIIKIIWCYEKKNEDLLEKKFLHQNGWEMVLEHHPLIADMTSLWSAHERLSKKTK